MGHYDSDYEFDDRYPEWRLENPSRRVQFDFKPPAQTRENLVALLDQAIVLAQQLNLQLSDIEAILQEKKNFWISTGKGE